MKEIRTTITTVVELTQTFYVSDETYEKLQKYEMDELYDDEELAKEYYDILDNENEGGILERAEVLDTDDIFSLNLVEFK
jgi:hypothetical protein